MGTVTRGARVLVVDDDDDTARTVSGVLDACGFCTASVGDARAAIEVTLDEDVDVVVCGFSRRGIGATTDLVTRFRRRPEPQLRDARIVAVTGCEEDAHFGLADAADGVLVRPVPAQHLADLVTEVSALDRDRSLASRRRAPRQSAAPSRSRATSTAS